MHADRLPRVRPFAALFVVLCALSLAAAQPAPSAPPLAPERSAQNLAYLAEVTQLLGRNFYDRARVQEEWPAIVERHRDRIRDADDAESLHDAIVRALAELRVSHLSIIPPYVWTEYVAPEFENRLTLRSGFAMERIDGRYICMGAGGPAAQAGLRRGDEILRIDGEPVATSPAVLDAGSDYGIPQNPHFIVRVREGERLVVTYRRTADEKPRTIDVLPHLTNDIVATRESVRVLEQDGLQIGYVHCVHFLHEEITRIVWTAMRETFNACDALIIDLRGSGGSPRVIRQLLAPFYEPGNANRRGIRGAPRWNRPVVALIDGNARSAKEVFAHVFRRDNLGVLVGQPTAGAVLGAQFPALSDGARLIVPVVEGSRYTSDRAVLEGNPVQPHVYVPGTFAYAKGRDEILLAGLKAAATAVRSEARAAKAVAGR